MNCRKFTPDKEDQGHKHDIQAAQDSIVALADLRLKVGNRGQVIEPLELKKLLG